MQFDPFILENCVSIYNHTNTKFRGGALPEIESGMENNPILNFIKETMEEYSGLGDPALVLSFFNIFCNMMPMVNPTFPLMPAPPQTGQKWGQVMSSTNLQRRNGKSQTSQNGQFQYVSAPAASGPVATYGGGGKRRTHKKCYTKKTHRTQKNHKRKRHGTQRKRSH